jgi:hypothetical protein
MPVERFEPSTPRHVASFGSVPRFIDALFPRFSTLTAELTAKPGENQRNRETPGDKATQVEHHQAAPAAFLSRLLAS